LIYWRRASSITLAACRYRPVDGLRAQTSRRWERRAFGLDFAFDFVVGWWAGGHG
jgi:hypothetical protein